MNLKSQAISGVKWSTFSMIFGSVMALLKISILTRFLDKSDFGLMALVVFILGFANLFMDIGLTSAILYKQNISKNEYSSLYWLNVIFSFFLYLVIIGLTPAVAEFYSESELTILFPLMGLSLILSAIGKQFKTIEQKALNFKFIAFVEIGSSLISIVVATLLAMYGYGVYSLVYSALVLFTISNISFLIKGIKGKNLNFHYTYKEVRPFLKIGVYNFGGQLINYFNKGLDVLIVGKFFGTEILGGYSLAKQLVQRPFQILNPIITNVASPILARMQFDKEKLKDNYLKLVNVIATLNIPIYIILIIMASPIVKIFYGPGFDNIVMLVRILSVYMIFIAVRNPIGSLIVATGKTYLEFYWFLVTFPLIPIAIIIGSQFNIEWVALSMIIAMMVLFIPFWWFVVKKMIPINFNEYVMSHLPNFIWLKRIIDRGL